MWKTLEKLAGIAEDLEETAGGYLEVAGGALEIVDEGVRTARFIDRGRDMVAHLEERAEEGRPPGILKTGEEILRFLDGDRDGND